MTLDRFENCLAEELILCFGDYEDDEGITGMAEQYRLRPQQGLEPRAVWSDLLARQDGPLAHALTTGWAQRFLGSEDKALAWLGEMYAKSQATWDAIALWAHQKCLLLGTDPTRPIPDHIGKLWIKELGFNAETRDLAQMLHLHLTEDAIDFDTLTRYCRDYHAAYLAAHNAWADLLNAGDGPLARDLVENWALRYVRSDDEALQWLEAMYVKLERCWQVLRG